MHYGVGGGGDRGEGPAVTCAVRGKRCVGRGALVDQAWAARDLSTPPPPPPLATANGTLAAQLRILNYGTLA